MQLRSRTACVHRIARRQVRSCFQGRGRAHTRKLFILRPYNLGSEAPAQEGVSAQTLRVTLKRRFEVIRSDTILKPTSKHGQYLMLCTVVVSCLPAQFRVSAAVRNARSAQSPVGHKVPQTGSNASSDTEEACTTPICTWERRCAETQLRSRELHARFNSRPLAQEPFARKNYSTGNVHPRHLHCAL